ncbi:MAG: alpha/beta hydrolase [Clostridiales bacterium]|nr:alpha/beta hydrolase [Clostridiales bacterium]
MAINKFMHAALKALSYKEVDLKKNYKLYRSVNSKVVTPVKLFYKISDFKIHLDEEEIPIRVFHPEEKTSDEVFLFFHGGGWVLGDIDTYTKPCASLASATGRRVMSVDYRLAPEHPFPCGLRDCYHAAMTICENSRAFELDPEKMILIGDSAGANLAACINLMARDNNTFVFKNQILLYPATWNDHSENSKFESVRAYGKSYLLTSKRICDYVDLYIQNAHDFYSPYFAPLLADDLSNQPRTLLITAEYDPLRDEGEAYGEKLRTFGNNVEQYRMKDALHGFFSLPKRFIHVQRTYDLILRFLDKHNCEAE